MSTDPRFNPVMDWIWIDETHNIPAKIWDHIPGIPLFKPNLTLMSSLPVSTDADTIQQAASEGDNMIDDLRVVDVAPSFRESISRRTLLGIERIKGMFETEQLTFDGAYQATIVLVETTLPYMEPEYGRLATDVLTAWGREVHAMQSEAMQARNIVDDMW